MKGEIEVDKKKKKQHKIRTNAKKRGKQDEKSTKEIKDDNESYIMK